MIPDFRHLQDGFSPMDLVTAAVGTILKGWDVVIFIDGDDSNRLGPLGQAKTRMALWLDYALAYALGIEFDMDRDLIVQDDLTHFKSLFPEWCEDCKHKSRAECPVHRLPVQILHIDEAPWFTFNEFHAFVDVRMLTPIFDSNRKESRVWILCGPIIWKTIEILRESRIQVRIRMKSRSGVGEDFAVAEVFLRAGALSNNSKLDAWGGRRYGKEGLPNSVWPGIPKLPEWDGFSPWDRYMDRYEDHTHTNRCVSRLRA